MLTLTLLYPRTRRGAAAYACRLAHVSSTCLLNAASAFSLIHYSYIDCDALAAIPLVVAIFSFFLPPLSIILMTAPIVLAPLKAAGFDLICSGGVMTG